MSAKSTLVVVRGAPLVLAAGVLRLSEQQAAPRRHALKALGDGVFELVGEVQFKAGERLGWVGKIPKRLAAQLVPPQTVVPPAAGRAAAAAGATAGAARAAQSAGRATATA